MSVKHLSIDKKPTLYEIALSRIPMDWTFWTKRKYFSLLAYCDLAVALILYKILRRKITQIIISNTIIHTLFATIVEIPLIFLVFQLGLILRRMKWGDEDG